MADPQNEGETLRFIDASRAMTHSTNSDNELLETLAAIEHERWADWQKWMHTKFVEHSNGKGKFVCLPTEIFSAWQRQLETDYADLSEREKQSDRDQVARYLPIIEAHYAKKLAEVIGDLEKLPKGAKKDGTAYKKLKARNGLRIAQRKRAGL